MTARQVFEATLIELSKIQAPSLKLYEFNYLFNKAINQYINRVYNVYDINQLTTDDLRVLKSTCYLTPHKVQLGADNRALRNVSLAAATAAETDTETDTETGAKVEDFGYTGKSPNTSHNGVAKSYLSKAHSQIQSLHGATYEVFLPIDYLHMLNCVCIYYVAKTKDCWDAGSYIEVPANRLTADSWSQIVTDIYNRPSPMRPYYYIHNMNQLNVLPTDPVAADTGSPSGYKGTDLAGTYLVANDDDDVATATQAGSNFQRTFRLDIGQNGQDISLVEKPTAVRIGNTSNVRCEIRYGKKLNDRKYSRFARYHGNMIDERDNIGELCDGNTELTDLIAKG